MQMIEFSKSGNVIYHIDTESKTVVAKLRCHENDPMTLIGSQLMRQISGDGFGPLELCAYPYYFSRFKIRNEYCGKAKCHSDDEFNIEFGKRLALLRAKQKYLNAIERVLEKSNRWVEEVGFRIDKLYMNHYRKAIDNGTALHNLLESIGDNN